MGVVRIGCETCNKRYHCDSMTEFECLKSDFRYYSPDYSTEEPAQSKPKYNSLIINSSNERPSSIEEELNKYFAENPTDTIFSVKEITTFRGKSLLVIFEKH
jgi:hypothetical protein